MATPEQPLYPDLTTVIDMTTILSLLSTLLLLLLATTLSLELLPRTATAKTRALFVWHAFDALIHFCLEGGYLYHCFFSWTSSAEPSPHLPPGVFFLGQRGRLYGSRYGTGPLAALWREYARADRRWGGSDLTVVSLELLTVGVAAPLAAYICALIVRQRRAAWFWMMVVAVGELYGGWMTFAPEWLAGSPHLDTGSVMYLWVYLVFFNTLWVWVPGWVLYESYRNLVGTPARWTDEPVRVGMGGGKKGQ